MSDAQVTGTPKFWFEYDQRRYGARFLTIGEQVQAQVEIERLTNGNYSKWIAAEGTAGRALLAEFATYLNKAVVAWPSDVDKFDFLMADDSDMVFAMWEAYSSAAKEFRDGRRKPAQGTSSDVAGSAPAA